MNKLLTLPERITQIVKGSTGSLSNTEETQLTELMAGELIVESVSSFEEMSVIVNNTLGSTY